MLLRRAPLFASVDGGSQTEIRLAGPRKVLAFAHQPRSRHPQLREGQSPAALQDARRCLLPEKFRLRLEGNSIGG